MSAYKRKEVIGDATLYLGDCLDVMAGFPECFRVNAVVTDPPYGINWSRATWKDSAEEYPNMMRSLVSEWNRLASDGFVFVFQAMLNAPRWHEWFGDDWRIFAACKNFAQIRPTGVWHSWDPVIFWKNGPNSRPNSGHINRDYHVGNVAGVFGDKVGHPSPRPLDTMRHIVQLAAASGGTICDSFMGSGTTGVACAQLGRKFIGIEIEEQYFDIACERIARAEAQPDFFVQKPEQEALI